MELATARLSVVMSRALCFDRSTARHLPLHPCCRPSCNCAGIYYRSFQTQHQCLCFTVTLTPMTDALAERLSRAPPRLTFADGDDANNDNDLPIDVHWNAGETCWKLGVRPPRLGVFWALVQLGDKRVRTHDFCVRSKPSPWALLRNVPSSTEEDMRELVQHACTKLVGVSMRVELCPERAQAFVRVRTLPDVMALSQALASKGIVVEYVCSERDVRARIPMTRIVSVTEDDAVHLEIEHALRGHQLCQPVARKRRRRENDDANDDDASSTSLCGSPVPHLLDFDTSSDCGPPTEPLDDHTFETLLNELWRGE